MSRQDRRWGRGLAAIAIIAALLALLAHAPVAAAAYDPLGSGTTTLKLERSFRAFLRANDVRLAAKAPAKSKRGIVTLPISGGLLDPTSGKGTIESAGALIFESARRKVPLRQITVKTKHSPLIAKVGGSQLKVASSSRLAAKREGFGSEFSARSLKLSAKVAERLNKKLRPQLPFKTGQPIGSLLATTQPRTVTILERNRATLEFNPEFLAKLEALHVSANPIFPAEHQGPSFSFPIIAGGALAPDASAGTLRSGGELELLQLGGGQIFWHELWADLGARVDSAEANIQPAPPYAGKTGRIGLFDLGAGAVASDPRGRTIGLAGAPLTLQAATATTLNEAFAEGRPLFRAAEALGTLSFTAQAQ